MDCHLTLVLPLDLTQSKEAGKLHNTHVLINPAGAIATTYRKVHLFDVDIPGNKLTESSFTGGGESMVAADVGFGEYTPDIHEIGWRPVWQPAG